MRGVEKLPEGRTLVMGILNVTPDSFSDGGKYCAVADALDHARAMRVAGADIIDVGGESTRPGAVRVSVAEEQRRILPVIRELAAEGAVVSVDTLNHETASAAVEAGAAIVNDVSGMSLTEDMAKTVAELGVPYILTHARGDSTTMDRRATYTDTLAEVMGELRQLRGRLVSAGVDPDQIIIDPGLGFAKAEDHNWELLAGIDQLRSLGHPVLVAASRKRFIAALLGKEDQRRAEVEVTARPTKGRDAATAAISTLAALAGAWAVRVHEVGASADSIAVVQKIRQRAGADRAVTIFNKI